MGYTNETTHYGIPLPLGSDLTTPMDYNTAAEAVDAAVFEAVSNSSGAVDTASEAVQTANAASTTAAGAVTEAQTAHAVADSATTAAATAQTTANAAQVSAAGASDKIDNLINLTTAGVIIGKDEENNNIIRRVFKGTISTYSDSGSGRRLFTADLGVRISKIAGLAGSINTGSAIFNIDGCPANPSMGVQRSCNLGQSSAGNLLFYYNVGENLGDTSVSYYIVLDYVAE